MNSLVISQGKIFKNYVEILESEGMCSNRNSLFFYLTKFLFKDIDFAGKSLMDIGSGAGIYSFFAGSLGAKKIVCLEPELEGARKANVDKFERLQRQFSLRQLVLEKVTFQDFDPKDDTFDIILLHSSINHLDEEACENLHRSEKARKTYEFIFKKCSDISIKGSKLIIADCSRYNFFGLFKAKNPLAPTIEWSKHQSPYFWSKILKGVGYIDPQIKWTSPGRLRAAGKVLLSNPVASYFIKSHFVLTLTKA